MYMHFFFRARPIYSNYFVAKSGRFYERVVWWRADQFQSFNGKTFVTAELHCNCMSRKITYVCNKQQLTGPQFHNVNIVMFIDLVDLNMS